MTKKPVVEHVDYHRNGVGGVGFKVAIVNDPENGRMLVVDFSHNHPTDRPRNQITTEEWENYGYTAVLDLDKASEGNIYMFSDATTGQPGGNAWRGDRLGDQYRPLINAEYDRRHP